jgi:long-subunit acyl-CoA synthetase (AMP-forming)
MGYLNKEAETHDVMTEDAWLKLGDLGYLDEDGFVSVLGKEDNFITLNTGEVISPFRVRQKKSDNFFFNSNGVCL